MAVGRIGCDESALGHGSADLCEPHAERGGIRHVDMDQIRDTRAQRVGASDANGATVEVATEKNAGT